MPHAMTFKGDDEFVAVDSLSFTPLVLQVQPSLGARMVSAFLQLERRRDVNMGSSRAGRRNHRSASCCTYPSKMDNHPIQGQRARQWSPPMTSGEVDFSFDRSARRFL